MLRDPMMKLCRLNGYSWLKCQCGWTHHGCSNGSVSAMEKIDVSYRKKQYLGMKIYDNFTTNRVRIGYDIIDYDLPLCT
jgi:hypothetical protein